MKISGSSSPFTKFFHYLGPGILVSVGYMDPGNWATDIEAGSGFGHLLLCIVLLSSLGAILLQYLSLKLGIVTGMDLAQVSRSQFHPTNNIIQWLFAEIAVVATDLAEVLGSALAIKLLFGCSLLSGVMITCLDALLILLFTERGFRRLEAVILALVTTVTFCFVIELLITGPHWASVFAGYIPSKKILADSHIWYLAIGIIGATIMPHNLYLHSAVIQNRQTGSTFQDKTTAIQLSALDTVISLSLAFLVNSAILILAASTFHQSGHYQVNDIEDAHHLLEPLTGSSLAPILFAVALLASGLSSTLTGAIAGQVVLEGFLNLKIPSWRVRLVTRGLALIPAIIGISILGDRSTGKLLVITQVILGLQLPLAVYPLVKFTSDKSLMGSFTNCALIKLLSWGLFFVLSLANLWLLIKTF